MTEVKWKCHRSSCGFAGTIPLLGYTDHFERTKKLSEYTGELVKVPEDILNALRSTYELTPSDIARAGFMWAPKYDGARLAMPIKSRFQTRVGWVFRSLTGKKPKTLNMLTMSDMPAMSWYPSRKSTEALWAIEQPLVIVEDQLSAYKTSAVAHAVSLLGTHLSEIKLLEIMKAKPKELIIALDEDATAVAASILTKFSGLVDNIRMVQLKRDLKDENSDEIANVLKL